MTIHQALATVVCSITYSTCCCTADIGRYSLHVEADSGAAILFRMIVYVTSVADLEDVALPILLAVCRDLDALVYISCLS